MSEPQYPPVVPSFAVRDVRASMDWFARLGFVSKGEATTPDGSIMHAEMSRDAALIMLAPAQPGRLGAPGLSLYLPLKAGIDDLHARCQRAGVEIAEPLTDQFWGDRTFTVRHPDGYELMFAQQVAAVSMEQIQEHLAQPV